MPCERLDVPHVLYVLWRPLFFGGITEVPRLLFALRPHLEIADRVYQLGRQLVRFQEMPEP